MKEYPLFVQDIIKIIDYDLELTMEGLASITFDILNNNHEKIYNSLIRCKLTNEAKQLIPKYDNCGGEI